MAEEVNKYEALRQKLMQEEIDKAIPNEENDQKRVMTSAIPMLAGVLFGNATRGAQMTQQMLTGYEAEKSKNKANLLSYLSKMKPKDVAQDWEMKNVDGKVVQQNSKTGEIRETQYKPFEKDVTPTWQQLGGTKTAQLFRKNPETGLPEVYDTKQPMTQRPNYYGIAEERLKFEKDKDLENRATKVKEELEPIQNVEFPLASVEKYLSKNAGKKDLATLGPVDRLRADYAPFTLGSDDKEFKSQVDSLLRQEAFATGGKTLTSTEKEIATAAYGYLKMGDEENFRRGILKLREFVDMRKASALASQKPEAGALYKERFKAQGGVEPSGKTTRPISEIRSEKAAIEAELQKLKGK